MIGCNSHFEPQYSMQYFFADCINNFDQKHFVKIFSTKTVVSVATNATFLIKTYIITNELLHTKYTALITTVNGICNNQGHLHWQSKLTSYD
ncbi:hypothetical protein CH381_26125 [Leptospira sp. mixed culture ATI2-C-A1]|nr:hypothetical protein CH381_26125 [Leptospira sp. mixed culture ATI2-C-A1]